MVMTPLEKEFLREISRDERRLLFPHEIYTSQTGESYAGHYVPHFSRWIFDQNKDLKPGNIHVNLAGFAVGDGLVDPYSQYQEYARYAKDYGLIGEVEYAAMLACLPDCLDAINNCSQTLDGLDECILATDICELCEVEPVIISTGINPS